jgi:CheY-like chemotaxis protein
MKEQKTVLCVDDNDDNLELLKILFELADYQVTACSTGEECLEQVKKGEYSAIVLDYRLPDKDGLEICREIRELVPGTPIVFYTADVRNSSRQAAFSAGADAYLLKPDDLNNIISTVNDLTEKII